MSGIAQIVLLLLALLGTPLFIVIFLATALSYGLAPMPIDMTNVFVALGDLLDKNLLIPIPLFIFAGYLLARSKTPDRMVNLAEAFLGWLPGGLGVVAVSTLAFFTAFTGASGVTIVALGGLLYPVLKERKYSEKFSLGVLTGSGSLGLLFFPSLPIFLYVTVYTLSAESPLEPEHVFLGGILPGFLMLGLFSGYSIYVGKTAKIKTIPFDRGRALKATKEGAGELAIPLVILATLLTGVVSIQEVATVTVVYVMLLVMVIHRDISPVKDLPRIARESMMLVGAIVLILALILGMNTYLIDQEVPQKILAYISARISSKVTFLILLNVFLLVVGCLMDIFSAILAVLPLIIPLAEQYQVDPVHLGIIFLANLEIGYMTPPVGMNLFISSFHFRKEITAVMKSIVPWILLMAIALIAVTWFEPLSMWLPRTFGYVGKPATEIDPGMGPGMTGDPTGDLPDGGFDPDTMLRPDDYLDDGDGEILPDDPGGELAPDEGGEIAPDEGGEIAPDEGGEIAPDEGGEIAPDEGGEIAPDP